MNNMQMFVEAISRTAEPPTINEYKKRIAGFLYIMENENLLTEDTRMLEEGLEGFLHKFGVHVKKGDGLIQYLTKATVGTGQILLAAMKGDKKRVKEIASKLDRGTVLDFLLKLDQATLHVVTGPIHMIDAITGWHIGAEVKKKVGNAMHAIEKAIKELKSHVSKVFNKMPEKIEKVNELEHQLLFV